MSERSLQPVTFPPSAARKMALDEESFQLLLAAAYALQENKDVLQASNSEQDSATVLSDVAALRSQILAHVDADESKALNCKDSQAKTPAESKSEWDLYKMVKEIPVDQAWRPLSEGGCAMVAKKT